MGRKACASNYKQSGVIPYRKKQGKIEVMLITSRNKGRWIIPKGVIEPDLNPRASAAKEAFEEAGVQGDVHSKLLGLISIHGPPLRRRLLRKPACRVMCTASCWASTGTASGAMYAQSRFTR
jgi:8-oxo-dGTP pyrophosphatase MutT (NUDIX family)